VSFWLALPAGLAAAALAYLINRFALGRLGGRAVWLAIPVMEEVLKSGAALFAGASIAATHLTFGAVEAVYEVSGRRPSPTAAGLALATHALLGLLTSALFLLSRSIGLAVASAVVAHTLYNRIVTMRAAVSDGEAEGGARQ
jgi:hypothetical protein